MSCGSTMNFVDSAANCSKGGMDLIVCRFNQVLFLETSFVQ